MLNRTIGSSGLVLLLLLALAAMGIGVALWSKVLTIEGVIQTGTVNAAFIEVFTDDDDAVDNPNFDSQDTGNCEISVGPQTPPPGFEDKNEGPTSCDPSETGRDPKDHYNKDVARCDARAVDQDEEPQPGSQLAQMVVTNGYPSYHCTAWFQIRNNGSIPIHLHSVAVQNLAATPCQLGSTPYDLDGDTQPDVEICISGLQNCTGAVCPEPQIHPGQEFFLDVDIHVMQTARQAANLSFDATVCLHQWNEETGNCPDASHDIPIDCDGNFSPFADCPAAQEVAFGDTINHWPAADPDSDGIDTFDTDGNGSWTFGANGDDIHQEAPAGCPTALRNAVHDLGFDCKILDINGSLADQQPVTCDLETLIDFDPGPAGCDAKLGWHDSNGDGEWDNGEDIVYDGNANGIYD